MNLSFGLVGRALGSWSHTVKVFPMCSLHFPAFLLLGEWCLISSDQWAISRNTKALKN